MTNTKLPSLYLSHGAPPLLDGGEWADEIAGWGKTLPRPKAILVASAHWESAPLTIGATETVPLYYDFYGFPQHYYEAKYASPGAPELAKQVEQLVSDLTPVAHAPKRGLDHGAFIPLMLMYPEADIPVLQISLPSDDPASLLEVGKRLAPLRDEGVLIQGSGFLTHNLRVAMMSLRGEYSGVPEPLAEFDQWAAEALARQDIDSLLDYRAKAPAPHLSHPTPDHWIPFYVALGAALEDGLNARTAIDGFEFGNSKRSIEFH
jgi:4,5-DOPA dioxygenase extradiol